ncbi:UNVERIFIED_ORG: MFS family permease [Arthrobacter sp. UYCu721]
MSTSTTTARIDKAGARLTLPVAALAFVIALAVQFIGQAKIDLGIGTIVIFPMVWGLILGLLVSIQKFKPLGLDLQRIAAALVGVAVLLLVARLAFNIGPSLPSLLRAGPALLLQEVGHLLGTIALALPLAVLLRMGKATVGATFSLDREPSFAMVSEKYGPDSDQYRGVLAMYVFGTLFGAVYITLLTSLVANWKIFDPLALAMGAGVGSGSMMAASSASIIAAYPADQEAILGMAAVSNLITTILGVYVGIYIALPLADRFYKLLTRRQTREAAAVAAGAPGAAGAPAVRGQADIERDEAQAEENRRFRERVAESSAAIKLPLWLSLSVLTVLGIGTASVAARGFSLTIVGGYGIMLALVLVSIALAKVTRKISAIVYITTIGAYISSPWFFGAEALTTVIKTVDFLSIATVMLTLAGLSLGKDIPLLKNIGWKIIPVGLVAITASFLLSTVIAEFALGLWH